MCDTDTYIGTDRMQDVMAVLSCRVQRFQDAVVPTGQRLGLFLHLWFYFLSLL